MSGINVKMGVSGIAQFKDAMSQGKAAVKALDAELKLNAAQYKQSGDKEEYLRQRTDILNRQIKEQEKVVKAAQQALQQMTQNGADPASTAYQNMQTQLMNAQASLVDMQTQLSQGTDAFEEGSDAVDEYAEKLNSIDKGVSFQSTIQGLKMVKGVAQTVINVIKGINSAVNEASDYADELTTTQMQYDDFVPDTETLQKWEYANDKMKYDTDSMLKAMDKIYKLERRDGSIFFGDYGIADQGDPLENFWAILDAISMIDDAAEQANLAQEIFGKSWRELKPLVGNRAQWDAYLQEAEDRNLLLDEQRMDELNKQKDADEALDDSWTAFKNKLSADVAPVVSSYKQLLTSDVDTLSQVLDGKMSIWEALGKIASNDWNWAVHPNETEPLTHEEVVAEAAATIAGSNESPALVRDLLFLGGDYTAEELAEAEASIMTAAENNANAMVEGIEQGIDASNAAGAALAQSFVNGASGSTGNTYYSTDGTYINTVNVTGVQDVDAMNEAIAQANAKNRAGTGG